MSVGSLASTPRLQELAAESRIIYPREGPRCEHGILGESPALLETVRLIRLAVAAGSTVLILSAVRPVPVRTTSTDVPNSYPRAQAAVSFT